MLLNLKYDDTMIKYDDIGTKQDGISLSIY